MNSKLVEGKVWERLVNCSICLGHLSWLGGHQTISLQGTSNSVVPTSRRSSLRLLFLSITQVLCAIYMRAHINWHHRTLLARRVRLCFPDDTNGLVRGHKASDIQTVGSSIGDGSVLSHASCLQHDLEPQGCLADCPLAAVLDSQKELPSGQ